MGLQCFMASRCKVNSGHTIDLQICRTSWLRHQDFSLGLATVNGLCRWDFLSSDLGPLLYNLFFDILLEFVSLLTHHLLVLPL